MSAAPETSVIIPVRNGEAFILDAITSVLDQIGQHDEVLVIDDASTDRTRAVLDGRDSRIIVLDGVGRGPSAARNIGLAQARGGFIAFLDHDDLWPQGRHHALLAALAADPTINAAAGRLHLRVEPSGSPGVYQALDGQHAPSILMTCLYRRPLIDKTGRFEEDMRYGEDLSYYVRLVEAGMRLAMSPVDALVYRRHQGNATNSAPSPNSILLSVTARKLARKRGNQTLAAKA